MVGFQNLGHQIIQGAKVPDGFLLGQSPFHPHLDVLGVFVQDILLFRRLQNPDALLQLFQKFLFAHRHTPSCGSDAMLL